MLWTGVASAQTVAAIPKPPQKPVAKLDKDVFAKEVCGLITRHATANGLPETFFARLIWKESLFDPGAVSPVGAQGIAQFMPGTAAIRGLQDPFDHKEALSVSAQYLAFLRNKFGNLGLAAAAYNFGEEGARLYIAGKSSLPLETEDYVQFITGRAADIWKDEKIEHPIPGIGKGGDFGVECVALVKRELRPISVPGRAASGGHGAWCFQEGSRNRVRWRPSAASAIVTAHCSVTRSRW
ncbi:MAG: lytic transglycosylase domain-containing protein [Rhizobiales bacterium]|nr:lytic transglycosylase domain-containing protein [Hyphomicrobiales bacterium]